MIGLRHRSAKGHHRLVRLICHLHLPQLVLIILIGDLLSLRLLRCPFRGTIKRRGHSVRRLRQSIAGTEHARYGRAKTAYRAHETRLITANPTP